MKYYPKKKTPYTSKKTIVDGITFASATEAKYYQKLKALQQSGELSMFLLQPRFETLAGTRYTADFLEFWENGDVIVTDVKSTFTAKKDAFIRVKKQVESLYPITINVVTKV